MKDHRLKALVQVAESGSIRAAARALHLSQSALTKALRELEESVGAELLLRSYKGIEFTEAGTTLLSRARLALSILDKARDEIRLLRGGAGATVAIGVTPLVAALVLPRVLREYERQQPDARIRLTEGLLTTVLPALMEGSLDFALVIADAAGLPYELEFEALAPVPAALGGRVGLEYFVTRSPESLAHEAARIATVVGSEPDVVTDTPGRNSRNSPIFSAPRSPRACVLTLNCVTTKRRPPSRKKM